DDRSGLAVRELTGTRCDAYADQHQRSPVSRWSRLQRLRRPQERTNPLSAQLEAAVDRLDAALDRLEKAIAGRESRLAAEREQVAAELREAQPTQAALQAEARSVSSRLDAAIGRLRAV